MKINWPHSCAAEKGMKGFFQGVWPPLVGSSFYRMAMLSTYEASYTYFAQLPEGPSRDFWHAKVVLWLASCSDFSILLPAPSAKASSVLSSLPQSPRKLRQICDGYVPRPLVFGSALCASLARSVVESPFEYSKTMIQTDQPWKLSECYRGVGMQTMRTTSMVGVLRRRKRKKNKGGGEVSALELSREAPVCPCPSPPTLTTPLKLCEPTTPAASVDLRALRRDQAEDRLDDAPWHHRPVGYHHCHMRWLLRDHLAARDTKKYGPGTSQGSGQHRG